MPTNGEGSPPKARGGADDYAAQASGAAAWESTLPGDRQTPWRVLTVSAAILVILAVFLGHAAYFIDYVNDDAYITFRYSRFLALQRGPYFNVGQHVEGYTNFLLMAALAPVIASGGEGAAIVCAKAVGVLSGAGAVLLTFILCRFLARRMLGDGPRADVCGVLASGLLAVAPNYALNSTSGLETTLFAFLISAGVLLGVVGAHKGRWLGCGPAFALAALTRPEGALVFAVYWFVQALVVFLPAAAFVRAESAGMVSFGHRSRLLKHLLLDGAIVTGVFACHLVFRLIAYDGEWLPNTYFAKAGGFAGAGAWEYLRWGAFSPFLGTIGVSVGLVGWLLAGKGMRASMPIAGVAFCGCLLPCITGTDWMLGYRLLVPFLPSIAIVVALGWCNLAGAVLRRRRWLVSGLVLTAVPVVWFTQSAYRIELHDRTLIRARGYAEGHAALAQWLHDSAAHPSDTIALMDIGIVGFTCIDQRILDITGLTDRFIAKSPGPFLAKQFDLSYVFHQRPEFIVIAFGSPQGPEGPPSAENLIPWTPIEQRIYEHPEFKERYTDHSPPLPPDSHWTQRVARQLGAKRVFEHVYPGRHYLLAVFGRCDAT